jgi:PAS domain S-box-containing protein
MSAAAEGTFVIGPFGRIEDVNDGACALLGYTRSELLALHGADLILPEERPAVAVAVNEMRLGTLERRRGRLLCKDGTTIAVEVAGRPLGERRLELRVVRTPD